MAIRVDNLNNLFWDNGSVRFPNTHPFLVNGKYLENTTPVMLSPTTGWVVLTGDFNYCEYKNELFFLKKDVRISERKNKWRYILIKDHVCTLFKNKANVLVKGTLTTTSLDKLVDTDFQFTLSVFNNFNKRILLPLNKQVYNWKKHIIPIAPTKQFDDIYSIDNKDYSIFLRQLENNKQAFSGYKFTKADDFTLLGRAKLSKKQHNWKNELIKKIKELLDEINNDNVILARFGSDYGGGELLRNKYVITYNSYSLGAHEEQFKQVLDLDLSSLTDIELISPITGSSQGNERFNLTLKEVQVDETRDSIVPTFIKKLARRNRVSFLSEYTTRAIYEKNEKLYTWFEVKDNREFWYPQKVFFKIKPSLLAKSQWQRNLPTTRKFEAYRSVYLYSVKNLNFVYRFDTESGIYWKNYEPLGTNFIDPDLYLTDNSNKAISKNYCYTRNGVSTVSPNYEDYSPWKKLKEPINIGWLIGQFSPFLKDNESKFEKDKPFIVKSYFTKLYRIVGLQDIVAKLIQNEDAYEAPTVLETKNWNFTLDIFNKLPLRARKATLEEDFLIGEKLLFTTWGLASYLLFQPIKANGYDYTVSSLDKDNALFGRWLTGASWFYYYSVFDEGHYVSEWAKGWMKMAYLKFEELPYERFYVDDNAYQNLKSHIKRNTESYFKSKEVNFANTPIKECKVGDIFFSDLDYFFYSYDGFVGKPDLKRKNSDWYTHNKDGEAELKNGEIVVYHDIQTGKLAIGKTYVWETEVILPEGQFIEEGRVNSDSSSNNIQRSKVTRITKLSENDTFDEIINVLRNRPQELFSNIIDFTLDDLKGKAYLFDLKGTEFYCYLDAKTRAHLIFKNDEKVRVNKKQIYAIGATEAIGKLSKVHWVNQKVNLSIFGHKVELPIKAFANRIIVTIELDTADLERRTNEALDSHKVEITHALGKTYLRFDTSKMNTLGTAQFNIFDVARTDIANMRSSQDYLIKRREYEINNQEMQLEHRHMRFENRMQKNALITDTIMGAIGGAVSGIGGIGMAVSTGLAQLNSDKVKSMGAHARIALGTNIKTTTTGIGLIGGVIGNAMKWSRFEEQTRMMEDRIGFQVEKKARESYNIDLGFQREKEDYEFNLRQTFSQQNIHQASSRERNLALDDKEADLEGLERKEDKEIYLELWTISDKQKEFVEEYHKEYGVDCRVAHSIIPFGNGMKQGVYRMEQVELLNLTDRIDLLLIKALFENGIKIVEWIEHEKVKELIPEDPRIAKLERQIEEANRIREQLEQEKHLLDVRIQELTVAIQNSKDEATRLTDELEVKKKQLEVTSKQLEYEVEKYDSLATGYRSLEEAKATEEKLKNLYLDETKKQRESINLIERQKADLEEAQKTQENLYKALVVQERQKASQIKRLNAQIKNLSSKSNEFQVQLASATRELEQKQLENQSQQGQIDKQLIQLQEKEKEIEELKAVPKTVSVDTHKNVDFIIGEREGQVVICQWNASKGIWQENNKLVVKRRDQTKLLRIAYEDEKFTTDQYLFWSWYTNEHHSLFNITVRTFNTLDGYVRESKVRNAHSWIGRYSVELDQNMPFLDATGNWVKPFWYHSTKGWFDYEIDSTAIRVNSYEDYLGLDKEVIKQLQKELQEAKDSLAAVREERKEGFLPAEQTQKLIAFQNQIQNRYHLFNKFILQKFFNNRAPNYRMRPVSAIIYVNNNYYRYYWDTDKNIFVHKEIMYVYYKDNVNYNSGTWSSYYVDTWFLDINTKILPHQPNGSYGNFNPNIKLGGRVRSHMGQEQYGIISGDIPTCYTTPTSKDDLLEKQLWFRNGDYLPFEINDAIHLKTYGDYLDLLGLDWDSDTKSVRPKSIKDIFKLDLN